MADQELPPQGPPAPPPPGGAQNLVPTNIEDEMKRSYLDYAMSVIVGRALPDIRDGLKPVHRRILYTMQQMGLQPNRPTRKCARIVGDAMGKYHPHGNLAIYDALVRLAQPFSMRYPLVEGQGNFGSVDGDPPAADRYTEARLSRVATALLEDLDKETVDFKPNYDDSELEPEVLPTRVPNLLVNGSSGIAVGMATNIPPHNLTEIINAAIHLIHHPQAPLAKLLEFVQGPDFPTGGLILGRQGILEAYTRGRGQLKIRARAKIDHVGKEKDQIIIDEIPYQVNKSKLLEQIATLVNEKRIEGIADVVDHSDRDGMRIVVELKRGEQAEVVLNNLYKNTQLQIGFGIIMLSIVNGQPRELGLVDMLKFFIDHRVEVVRRRTEFELRKARDREHILLGFQKALQNLDEVIKLIRAAKQPREARDSLIAQFQFSEKQAQAIIELQLQRLTGMEQQKILDELADIQRRIAEYLEILGSDKALRDVIVKELKEVQKEYGDERRTHIVEDTGEILLEDLVAVEDVAITVTRGGYLKRTAVDTYRRQTRGGKGRIGMGTRAEDVVEHLIVASTHSYLLIFTTRGRVYWLKAYEIPDASTAGKGKHISNLINLQPDEEVREFLSVKDFVPDRFVVMVTKHGVIKKSELTEFDNPTSRGIIAILLDEGDELIGANITRGDNYIFLGSREGQAIRFAESEVRPMGRQARGVRAMNLEEADYLVGLEVVEKEGLILSMGENGYGKRTPLEEYRLTGRGGKGVINMKTTGKTGKVVAILSVKEDSELVIVSQNGKIIRIESSTIRQAGRSTQGVRLVTLEEGDKVAAASVIPETDGNGNGNDQEPLPLQ
ncbi:MAG TPA: DNA gyrase subunit A [Bryobacteraceae bacterium]|nr:DNA gyrase subunit A [Bryobacteraceae bacterium]